MKARVGENFFEEIIRGYRTKVIVVHKESEIENFIEYRYIKKKNVLGRGEMNLERGQKKIEKGKGKVKRRLNQELGGQGGSRL